MVFLFGVCHWWSPTTWGPVDVYSCLHGNSVTRQCRRGRGLFYESTNPTLKRCPQGSSSAPTKFPKSITLSTETSWIVQGHKHFSRSASVLQKSQQTPSVPHIDTAMSVLTYPRRKNTSTSVSSLDPFCVDTVHLPLTSGLYLLQSRAGPLWRTIKWSVFGKVCVWKSFPSKGETVRKLWCSLMSVSVATSVETVPGL